MVGYIIQCYPYRTCLKYTSVVNTFNIGCGRGATPSFPYRAYATRGEWYVSARGASLLRSCPQWVMDVGTVLEGLSEDYASDSFGCTPTEACVVSDVSGLSDLSDLSDLYDLYDLYDLL